MKFTTKTTTTCGLLLCLLVIVNPAISETIKHLADEIVLPVGIKILPALFIPPPAGPIIMAALSVMQIISNIMEPSKVKDEEKVETPVTKVDLLEIRTAILDKVKTLDTHLLKESARIIRELTMSIETHGFFESLRETTDDLEQTFTDMMDVIIDSKVNGTQKRLIINDMLNYSSDYRHKLRSFITKFIKANVNELMLFKPVKLFYDFVLEKDEYLTEEGDNCGLDSLHNKIYKSFVFLLKVLTDGYSMGVSAHVIRYQEQTEGGGNSSDSEELRRNALSLINDYRKDVKILIDATERAMNSASREIRNCGNFHLEEGKTFERISFSFVLPKIFHLEYVDIFEYKCKNESFYKKTDYKFVDCKNYMDSYIPFGSRFTMHLDLQIDAVNKPTPFSFMKNVRLDGTEELFGHARNESGIQLTLQNNPQCYTQFCTAFKNNAYAISTQRVRADPGNVITGLRFRVRKRVIYVDIQQGNFTDLLYVDPKTVYWTESPESNQTEYLGPKLNKFELGDFVLKNNSLLRTIQFKKGVVHEGLIRLQIDGLTPPYMNNTNSTRPNNNAIEIHELKLPNADNPTEVEKATGNLKHLVSKAPVADKRHYVSFQPTDFRKDFGQSTVPLLDIREVYTNPPAPLSGIGIYHEAVGESGGLIALKLITPNMTSLLDPLKAI